MRAPGTSAAVSWPAVRQGRSQAHGRLSGCAGTGGGLGHARAQTDGRQDGPRRRARTRRVRAAWALRGGAIAPAWRAGQTAAAAAGGAGSGPPHLAGGRTRQALVPARFRLHTGVWVTPQLCPRLYPCLGAG